MKIVRLLIFFVGIWIPTSSAADFTDISRLRDIILTNYDTNSRPVQNHKNSTEVELYIYRYGIEFDDLKGVLTLHCLLVFDEHMKWDPLNFGNLTEVNFYPTEVWRPDVMVYNNYASSDIDHFGNTLVMVSSNGGLTWVPPAKLQVGCKGQDFRRWPYDTQECIVVMGSWAHDGTDINLIVRANHTEMEIDDEWGHVFIENREWKLVSNSIKRRVFYFPCCPDVPFIDVVINVSLQRRSSSHTAAITVVGLGTAMVILISFWLSPYAKERVPVILISMLVNGVYLGNLHQIIPYSGDQVPLAICFFRDSLIMVITALAWTMILRQIAKTKRNEPVPLPEIVEKLLASSLSMILCLNSRPPVGKVNAAERSEGFDDGDELVKSQNPYQEDWQWLAHLLDRVAFLSYFIVYSYLVLAFF